MRGEIQWLSHKGVEQEHVGRTEFSLAVSNRGENIFQVKRVHEPVWERSPHQVGQGKPELLCI